MIVQAEDTEPTLHQKLAAAREQVEDLEGDLDEAQSKLDDQQAAFQEVASILRAGRIEDALRWRGRLAA